MSQALWCDIGGHVFSARDENRRTWSETRTVMAGNVQTQIKAEIDVCGKHTADIFSLENQKQIGGSEDTGFVVKPDTASAGFIIPGTQDGF